MSASEFHYQVHYCHLMESDKNYMPSTDADEGEKSSLLAHVTQKNILPTGDALSNTMSCPPATENTIHQLSSHHLILVRSLYCQTDLKNCNTCWSFDCVANCRWSYPFDKQNWFSSRHTRKTNPRIYSPL